MGSHKVFEEEEAQASVEEEEAEEIKKEGS